MKRHSRLTWAIALLLCPLIPHTSADSDKPSLAPPPKPVNVVVAYYSRTGNTEQMARAVAKGAAPHASVTLKPVAQVTKQDLTAAHAIILGCPTYFANIPGEMKTVIDDWNWKWKVDLTDKIGGTFATAGGPTGGQAHVVVSLLMFMLHNRMIVAGPLYQSETTGSIWAEAGATAITGPKSPAVDENEKDAARRLGRRIALLAQKISQANNGDLQ